MLQTLFHIPHQVAGVPLFGFGLMLLVWAVAGSAFMTWLIRRQGFDADARGYIPVLLLIGAAIWFLLPILEEPQGLPIRGYGTMVLLGVVSGIWLAAYRAKRANLDPDIIYSLAFWLFLSGMAGARVFYVIEYWEKQFHKPTIGETLAAIANVAQGGLVVFGAFIGASAAFFVFTRSRRLPFLGLFDLVAPSMVLGLAIGRIGCFMNGCCFGGTCDLPWAVQFPAGSPPYLRQVQEGQLDPYGIHFEGERKTFDATPAKIAAVQPNSLAEKAGIQPGDVLIGIGSRKSNEAGIKQSITPIHTVAEAQGVLLGIYGEGTEVIFQTDRLSGSLQTAVIQPPLSRSLPIHPAQLYSALDALLLFLFLLAYYPYRKHDGELLAWMLMIHAVSRFLLEIVRTDESAVFGTGLSISQNISLGMFLTGAGLWYYLRRRRQELNFYAASSNSTGQALPA